MLLSKAVLDNVKSIVLLVNTKQEVEYVNPFLLALLGYTDKEKSKELFHKIDQSELQSLKRKISFFALRYLSNELQFNHVFKNKHGVQKWIQCHLSRIEDDKILLTGSDITQQKQNEITLLEKHRKLQGQTKQFPESLDYAKNLQ
jgi:PAS domain S-box-containing protein